MTWLRHAAVILLDAMHSVLSRDPGSAFLVARALVFAPHQDDEVLGCGGTILSKIAAGADVRCVFLTDGSASHRGLLARDELVALRRREALAAGGILGLAADRITFLGLPDGDLERHGEAAVRETRRIIESFQPDEVYVPHGRDQLPDHLATYRAVIQAIRLAGRPVRVLQYPVWLWNRWPWTGGADRVGASLVDRVHDCWELVFGCRVRVDARRFVNRKREALRAHASQTARPDNMPQWPVLEDVAGGEWVARFFTGFERFRESREGQ